MGVFRASVISPIPNKIAIEKANARAPLMISANTMLRGTTTAESFTSSPVRKLSADNSSRGPYIGEFLLMWLVPSIPEDVSVREDIRPCLRRILTNERPSRCQQAEAPRKTITLPPTRILKICKDESGSASR